MTTRGVPTGETPFLLAYRTKAIIPVDICIPTLRTGEINQVQNAIQLCFAQDQSEKRRREAQIRIVAYQQQIKAAHHKKLKPHEFQIGDLVLKRVIQSTKERNARKLRPNWRPEAAPAHIPWLIKMGRHSVHNGTPFIWNVITGLFGFKEVGGSGNYHFPLSLSTKHRKRKMEKSLFMFPFSFYTTISSLLRCYS